MGIGSVVGGIMGARGARQEGDAAMSHAMFQSWMAQINGDIEAQNAQWAMSAAEQNAYSSGLSGRTAMGKLTAAQGASGVDLNSGSFVNTRQSVENASLQDQSNVRYQGAQQYYGHKMQEWQYRAQSMMDLLEGQNAKKAAEIKAQGSMLGGILGGVEGLFSTIRGFF